MRSLGWLEKFELDAYDDFARWRYRDAAPDSRIALVAITERDVLTYGWPVSDEILARVIQTVSRQEPRAIGLDIYRDSPRPPGTDKLDAALRGEQRLIAVMKIAQSGADGVLPPPPLRGTERVGFSDILVDPGGVVRRGLIFLDDGANVSYSLPLRIALLYLREHNVVPHADPEHPSRLRLGQTTISPLESDDGGYVDADARGYQFLLDFKGASRQFASVDLTSLLTGAFEPSVFRDRIVLVGVVAESVERPFYTPFSHEDTTRQSMPGLAIHGLVASQLLRIGLEGDRPMGVLREWQETLWILLCSVLGALVGMRVHSHWKFVLTVVGCLVGVALLDLLAFMVAWWVPLVPAAAACFFAAVAVKTYMYYLKFIENQRLEIEKTQLMQLFAPHVSREVFEMIWRDRDQILDRNKLRPQLLEVTVLFTDLAGFTALAEKENPEAFLVWLDEYLATMTREVTDRGGFLRQYAGDAIVAIFGAPLPRSTKAEIDQDACRAVACALAMETELNKLNQRWEAQSRPTTRMRAGIFSGPAIGGVVGSAERCEYVVLGDTLNTASRLESLAKDKIDWSMEERPIRILIGEPTLQRLGGAFVTESSGEVSLKGKERLVGVHRVIGPSHAPEVRPATAPQVRALRAGDRDAAPHPT